MKTDQYQKLSHLESSEAIQMEILRSQDGDPDAARDDNLDNDSDSSVTSHLFADINEFSQTVAGDETFEDDPNFQKSWYDFKNGVSSSKLMLVLSAAICLLLWVIFLVIYSNGNARQKASSLWHGADTNIANLGHRNITLNTFDPNNQNVTFEHYRKGLYMPSFNTMRWLESAQFPRSSDLSAKGYYLARKGDKLKVLSADSTYEKTILDSNQFSYNNKFYYAQDVTLNPGSAVDDPSAFHVLRSDSVSQWRHSAFSYYWLWKPVTGEVFPIHSKNTEQPVKIHFARFDPSGKHVVFGYEHNLYIMNPETREVMALTESGSPDIFNGKPDWVYEEEVYPQDHMLWWDPKSKFMAYAQINDTNVASYNLDYYVKGAGEVAMNYDDLLKRDTKINQYPQHTSVKYPKPGTANPVVRLFLFDTASNLTQEVTGLADETVGHDFILYDATWIDDDNLLLKISDRHSSVLEKRLVNPSKSFHAELISMQNASDYNGWIEKASPITVIKRKDTVQYLDRVVVNNLVQLALFESAGAQNYSKVIGPVTSGSPLSYDALEDCVYGVFGTNLHSAFSSISLANKEQRFLAGDGDYGLNFSPNGQFLELRYNGPDQPWRKLVSLALVANDLGYVGALDPISESGHLSAVLTNTNLPTKVLSSVKVGRENEEVNMLEIFPPNFKKDEKHPLLVHVYGGPGSATVTRAFGVDFQDIVSSQLNAVVLIIDPRGTGTDDWKLKAHSKGHMGLWEPHDILAITKDYIATNAYIDEEKTAIWGWSYGGFTTLKTLENDKGEIFKYGMAVAPVTNWLFYDSVFTERIMGSPSENKNYEAISRINEFAHFKNVKRFLIMQGTADDNVHMQNSLWLMDNFDQAGVENYDVHFFPDSDHSIFYHNANNVVYDKLFWWLKQAFSGYFV
ncbi:hypothetical protein OXX79_000474 [Metschnikowia pulcherrima]